MKQFGQFLKGFWFYTGEHNDSGNNFPPIECPFTIKNVLVVASSEGFARSIIDNTNTLRTLRCIIAPVSEWSLLKGDGAYNEDDQPPPLNLVAQDAEEEGEAYVPVEPETDQGPARQQERPIRKQVDDTEEGHLSAALVAGNSGVMLTKGRKGASTSKKGGSETKKPRHGLTPKKTIKKRTPIKEQGTTRRKGGTPTMGGDKGASRKGKERPQGPLSVSCYEIHEKN